VLVHLLFTGQKVKLIQHRNSYSKATDKKYAVQEKYDNYDRQEGQHPLTGQRAPPISGGT